jgi:NitT/TauT family transport system substrate-binding protein
MHDLTNRPETFCTICAALVVLFLMGACSGLRSQPPDEVDVQLKWVHQAQFAGFYMAKEEGYYAEENLGVSFQAGGPEVDVLERITSGEVDFAVYSPEDLLIGRSKGKKLVAVAVIYRRNPMAFVSQQGSGIKKPGDLDGSSIAVASDGIVQFNALLKRLGLDVDQMKLAEYDYDYAGFKAGEVDVTEAYATGGMIRLQNQGYDLNVIWPDDYGIHFYGDTLITTEEFIEEKPGVVIRFLKATLRGWQEAMGNPDRAVEATLKYAADADPSVQRQMLEASVPLVHTGNDYPGWMEGEIWGGMYGTLLEEEMLDAPFAVENVYTMKFLKNIYEDAE